MALVDDMEEDVGGVGAVGEIADLVDIFEVYYGVGTMDVMTTKFLMEIGLVLLAAVTGAA